MIFNDSDQRREKLSVAISLDEGITWPYKRVISQRSDGSYPSMIETRDGWLHISCSVKSDGKKGIAHYRVDPKWISSKKVD